MTVLVVCHVPVVGGAERSLLDLLSALDRWRVSPLAVVPSPGELSQAFQELQVPVFHVPLRRLRRRPAARATAEAVWSWVRTAPRLARLIQAHGVDIVHANGDIAHFYAGPVARALARPTLWHCRDLARSGCRRTLLARCASRIIAPSAAVQASLVDSSSAASRCVVIPNGFDTSRLRPRGFREAARRRLGFPPEAYVVAMAAQMVPWKRHRLFLEAAERIARHLPSARFVIAGADRFGEHPGYVEDLNRLTHDLGLSDRVSFLGHRPDWLELLEGVDVLVHPTDREPFGRVVAEAMALEKPVVAVNAAGPRELIRSGQEGILVPAPDPDDIAAEVCALAGDPDRAARLGRAARARIANDFSLSNVAQRVQRLYEELIGFPPRRRTERSDPPSAAPRGNSGGRSGPLP